MSNPQTEDGFTRIANEIDLNGGWIRLYRKTLFSAVFQNETLLKVWLWCLLRACHSAQTVSVKTGRGETLVNLQPGQFIFGRNSASKELKLPASTVRNKIAKLKSMRNIDIKQDNHFSIISITAWNDYQMENLTGNRTGKGQAKDTYKNVKNVENLEREGTKRVSLVSLFSEIESEFSTEDLTHKDEFLSYWTEKNSNGKKERWQMEKVFDVKRRYQTWLRNYKRWTGQADADRKAEGIAEALKYWGQNNA